MLRGEVTSRRQAVVLLRLRGADHAETEVDVILDTGFTDELTLNPVLIESLGWPRLNTTDVILADGTIQRVNVYEGQAWWNYEWKTVSVQASDGMVLLGMGLLYDNLVTLEVVDGGEVTIEVLE